jgi:hypothetical protein
VRVRWRRDPVGFQEPLDVVAQVAARFPRRSDPRLDRSVAPVSRWLGQNVAHGHRSPRRREGEIRPVRASIAEDLVNALDLPARQAVFDVQIQADERLSDSDRPFAARRRLHRVRVDDVLMNVGRVAKADRVRLNS